MPHILREWRIATDTSQFGAEIVVVYRARGVYSLNRRDKSVATVRRRASQARNICRLKKLSDFKLM